MPAFDTLIINGRIIDGSGNPWFEGDVALSGDQIAAVTPPGRIAQRQAASVIDAAGHFVCPGFIDIQSHSIYPLMIDGRCVSKITRVASITACSLGAADNQSGTGYEPTVVVSMSQTARLTEREWSIPTLLRSPAVARDRQNA